MQENTSEKQEKNKVDFVFFGTSEEAVYALEALKLREIYPSLVVTAPDRPVGRHQTITAPLAKIWAIDNNINFFQPENINNEDIEYIKKQNAGIFIVVGYGRILPQNLIEIPKHKTINIHTSLLPLYRGPTPIEGPILAGDNETGVTIMEIDKKADHGPILIQEKYKLNGNETTQELTKILFTRGGEILADIWDGLMKDKIKTKPQNHTKATYTKKLKKEDGLVDIEKESPTNLYNKFRAYASWPRIYFIQNGKRVIITKAKLENNIFTIEKVIPEGKKEITWEEFLRNNK